MQNSRTAKKASKEDFLRTIARMYYILGLTQQDIAKKLNIGRSSVARFLAEARENGIVNISISDPSDFERHSDLENRLISEFHLKDAVVADCAMPNTFCIVAARYLDTIFPYSGTIATSGGRTLFSITPYMRRANPRPDLKVIQATGVFSEAVPAASCVQAWADALRATPIYLSAPGLMDNPNTRNLLMQDSSFKNAYAELEKTDLLVVGLGNAEDACQRPYGILESQLDMIRETSIGEVCHHFFDRGGNFCMADLSSHVVGISIDDYNHIPSRVGIAKGTQKADAIAAALQGEILNIIITDNETAEAMLNR